MGAREIYHPRGARSFELDRLDSSFAPRLFVLPILQIREITRIPPERARRRPTDSTTKKYVEGEKERNGYTLSDNDCSVKFMGYFNKGTGERAYSYPLYGASAEKPPVAPASNQYVTYTRRARRYRGSLPACLPPCLQEGNRNRREKEREIYI